MFRRNLNLKNGDCLQSNLWKNILSLYQCAGGVLISCNGVLNFLNFQESFLGNICWRVSLKNPVNFTHNWPNLRPFTALMSWESSQRKHRQNAKQTKNNQLYNCPDVFIDIRNLLKLFKPNYFNSVQIVFYRVSRQVWNYSYSAKSTE